MTIARSAAETIDLIISRVRLEVGDPAADASGNTIPAPSRRHSDVNIITKINDTLLELGTKMAINHSGEALVWTDFTYAEDTGGTGDDLPTGINAEGILSVTDVTDPNVPIEIFWVNALDLSKIPVNDPYSVTIGRRYYTLTADPADTSYRIAIRPAAEGRTFRVFWVATPYVSDDTATSPFPDTPLLSARWKELIALGTAIRLLSINAEVPDALWVRQENLMKDFISFSRRQKHPERVRMLRRFI